MKLKEVSIYLSKIKNKKIYLGHQSGGRDIMKGVSDLINSNDRGIIHVVNLNSINNLPHNYFAHSHIGAMRILEVNLLLFQ